jgi:hypothetical protein
VPQYLLQLSYTADSLKAQMKNPEELDRVVRMCPATHLLNTGRKA